MKYLVGAIGNSKMGSGSRGPSCSTFYFSVASTRHAALKDKDDFSGTTTKQHKLHVQVCKSRAL